MAIIVTSGSTETEAEFDLRERRTCGDRMASLTFVPVGTESHS